MACSPAIAVIDYHKGNLSSVARGLERAGARAFITDDPRRIRRADAIVLPGVGSFFDAAVFMAQSGQGAAVLETLSSGHTPFLGICLGLQLLFERGSEGIEPAASLHEVSDEYGSGLRLGQVFEVKNQRWVRGLGLLEGSCTELTSQRLKVPHVGWDQLHRTMSRACPLLEGVDEGANLYFTHSYALDTDVQAQVVAAQTFYTRAFASVVWRDNLYGCQFHPEKSSAHGLVILRNFVRIAAGEGGDPS